MKSVLAGVLSLLFASSAVFAADPAQTTADPKRQEMMKKWMEYSTPKESHKALEPLVGSWKFTSKMWESAKAKPEESTGTSSMKMVLGGRFLHQEVKGQAMGQPFEGLGYVGYNNLEKRYETVWLDSMGTGMMRGTGSFDAKTKTLKDSGEYTCPFSADKTRDYKSEWKILDKNSLHYTMWGPDIDTGKEFKQMEIVYKRSM
jgi:hypothetical protein